MAQRSSIEWTDATWNPIRGCSRVSEGCRHCYAERDAARFSGSDEKQGTHGPFHGFVRIANGHPQWTGKVELIQHKLIEPLNWKKSRTIFVNSMSDLFHESLPDADIAEVFRVMHRAPWHRYQILTKRAVRMHDIMPRIVATFGVMPHVWLGVSIENQDAVYRSYLLSDTPAAVRFLSIEPLLGPIEGSLDLSRIHWVIVGGESGPGARPMHPDWAREVRGQCIRAGVPFFFKQWGAWLPRSPAPDRIDQPAFTYDDVSGYLRVGKKAAGRLLDGREWNELPRLPKGQAV